MNVKKKVYLAAPLFSDAERTFNCKVKSLLQPYFDVYLPQEDGGLLVDMIVGGSSINEAVQDVFASDMAALRYCDLLIIVLDGRAIDEGASFELGCAYTLGKPCFGLKTDPRQLMKYGDNPMIRASLKRVFSNIQDLLTWATFYRNECQVANSEPTNKLSSSD